MQATPPSQPGRWESPLLAIPAVGVNFNVVVTHGRGSPPRQVEWVVVNLQPDSEFVPGDEIPLACLQDTATPFNPTQWRNGTQTGIAYNTGLALGIYTRATSSSSSLTRNKWALKAICTW